MNIPIDMFNNKSSKSTDTGLEEMEKDIDYWYDIQNELGYVSRWSVLCGLTMEDNLMSDKSRKITYTLFDANVEYSTFTSSGKVSDFYRAGEFLIKCAMRDYDDHHIFIEGFEPQEDGSFRMITGS
jgi:hypothetical protein